MKIEKSVGLAEHDKWHDAALKLARGDFDCAVFAPYLDKRRRAVGKLDGPCAKYPCSLEFVQVHGSHSITLAAPCPSLHMEDVAREECRATCRPLAVVLQMASRSGCLWIYLAAQAL